MPDGDGYLSEFNTEGAASRTAEKYRALNAGKWQPSGGISAQPGRRQSGLVLSALTSPSRWQVSAGFGVAVSSTGDVYELSISEPKGDNVAATSSGTTRLDRFVVRARDKSRGDFENGARVERIPGIETTGTPVLPTTGLTGAVFLDVGTMLVNSSGPSTTTPSNVFLSALGGVRTVTSTQRDALVAGGNIFPGDTVFDSTVDSLLTRNNAGGWDGLWQPYTSVWSQTGGTVLAIGNGTLVGSYRKVGRNVDVRIELTRGSTTNLGSTTYVWSLPLSAKSLLNTGTGLAVRGTSEMPCIARLVAPNQMALIRSADGARLGSASGAWATGDTIQANLSYELSA